MLYQYQLDILHFAFVIASKRWTHFENKTTSFNFNLEAASRARGQHKKLVGSQINISSIHPSCSGSKHSICSTYFQQMGQCVGLSRRPSQIAIDEGSECSNDLDERELNLNTLTAGKHFADTATTKPLFRIKFDRTLFVDDIIYQYQVMCSVHGIPSWTIRITVEELTDFYTDTFQQYEGYQNVLMLDEHGKIMRPETFSQCLQRVLDVPGLLMSEDDSISQKTADLLSIPYVIRSILLYNKEECEYVDPLYVGIDGQYKYLLSRTMPSYSDVDSLWFRIQHQKVDLLVLRSSEYMNQIEYIIACDFSKLIAKTLMDIVETLNEECAWMIADYLPRRIFLDPVDFRCNARIVYNNTEEIDTNNMGRGLQSAVHGIKTMLDTEFQPEIEDEVTEHSEYMESDEESGSDIGVATLPQMGDGGYSNRSNASTMTDITVCSDDD